MPKLPLLLLGLLLAGSARAAEPELTRRQSGDLAIQSRAILVKYCGECHKESSPISALSVLDHRQLVSLQAPVPFVDRRGGPRSQVLEFLEDGSMPPAGHERPTPAEIDTLKRWIGAKAPSYPKAFDPATTLRTLLDDFASVAEKDRPYIRYISMAHLVPAGTEPPNLKATEFNLQKALSMASEGTAYAAAKEVDDSATLFRLDIRTVGWHTADLFEKVIDHAGKGAFPMNAFDLILLEYPEAVPVAGPDAPRLSKALGEMKQLRPIPYLKAEWLSAALVNKAAPTALAEDLKAMIQLAAAVGKPKNQQPAGAPSDRFADGKSLRTEAPPLAAFYPRDVSSAAPPFPKLALDAIDAKGDTVAKVETEEPFRLRLTADADGHFVLLQRWSNGELALPEIGGGDRMKADKPHYPTPKKSSAFVISGLLNGKDSGTESFILLASPDEIPMPTIVRSLHTEFRIWRFLPADPAKPGSVQRVVAHLEVAKKSP